MNDRYLFSAKREDNGMWAEGYLIYDDRDHLYRIVIDVDYSTGTHIHTESAPRIDNHTICQCTGLKDKNGKMIWENDILMCYGNKKDLCKVCFGEFKVIDIENMVAVDIVQGWYYRPLETDGLSKCEPFCYEMPLTNYYLERMEAEVVGSVFDNPELLEK